MMDTIASNSDTVDVYLDLVVVVDVQFPDESINVRHGNSHMERNIDLRTGYFSH